MPLYNPSGSGGGSGTVTSVAATDTSIVVSGTPTTTPTLATATLDVIAADHAPAANWSNNSHKITSLANGSASSDAAAYGQTLGGGTLAPLTTQGDLLYVNGSTIGARLPVGASNAVLGVSSGVPAWAPGMILLATTGPTGYTLTSTGAGATIVTWTAPSDLLLHRVIIFAVLHITSSETGGQVTFSYTLPDGTASGSKALFAASLAAGIQYPSTPFMATMEAGTAFSVIQNSNLTVGTSVAWVELWGS